MTTLFTPIQVGRLQLAHRVALAPLTRFRNSDTHAPLPISAEYYAQRASVPGTLLITEATLISARAGTYPNVPGIYTEEQIKAWKQVTDSVHAKGSYIYLQLWALGRTASAEAIKADGYDLVSSSAKALDGGETPRALTEDEIQQYIQDYAAAAKAAVEQAGFDGVEIHAANGYLIDQFIQDTCNERTDKWGGSVENRARFALEVTKAVTDAVGADRTAIRLSPFSPFQGMGMEESKMVAQFTYLAQEIAKFKIAYLHLVEPRISGNDDVDGNGSLQFVLNAYADASAIVVAGGYKAENAQQAVDSKYKNHPVIVAFGRYFIANPDLPFRIREGIEFTPYSRDTFYAPLNPKGYVDYPFSEKFTVQAKA